MCFLLLVKSIKCPNDITLKLPLGKNTMALPLERLSINLNPDELISEPAGVLTGDYKFHSKLLSQKVTLKFKKSTTSSNAECEFHVTVVDQEPPVFEKCPPGDVYVVLNAPNGKVSWPEPIYKDNVNVTRTFVNLKNNVQRGQQVFFVYYSINDEFNNEAVCRFFVHVKGIYTG